MSDERKTYDRGVETLRQHFDAGVDARTVDDVQRKLRVALAKKQPRRPLVIGLSLGAAVTAVALAILLLPRHADAPLVAEPVTLVMRDATSAIGSSDVLAAGSRLAVSNGGRVDLAVGHSARIAVNGPALVTVDADGQVDLADGVAAVSVAKQAPGRQFAMRVGDATVIVHGTAFVVDAKENALHGASVSEGRVEVRPRAGAPVFLGPGEIWGEAPAAFASDPFAASWWQTASPSTVVIDRAPPAAVATEPAPVRPVEPEPRRAPARPAADAFALAETAVKRGQCAVAADHVARFVASAKDDNDAARALMLEADCWMSGRDKARALSALDRVASGYPKTARAASALFEASKLRSDLRLTKDAAAGFAAYYERYPSGPLAESASFRHCELVRDLGTPNSACLEAHLQRFPSGRRTGDALLMLGSAACEQRNWSDAERSYWRYVDAIPASRDDVRNLRALLRCLEQGKVGNLDKARATFSARHPEASAE